MVQSSQCNTRQKLNEQLRESCAKVNYSYVCHNYMTNRFISRDNRLKIALILLSAFTLASLSISVYFNEKLATIIGLISSLLVLIVTVYQKDFNLETRVNEHRKTADALWKIKEDFISLLIDFDDLELSDIRKNRDELLQRLDEIYRQAPRTDKRAYREAQKAIKIEEEQTFSKNEEVDSILPITLRKNSNE